MVFSDYKQIADIIQEFEIVYVKANFAVPNLSKDPPAQRSQPTREVQAEPVYSYRLQSALFTTAEQRF